MLTGPIYNIYITFEDTKRRSYILYIGPVSMLYTFEDTKRRPYILYIGPVSILYTMVVTSPA